MPDKDFYITLDEITRIFVYMRTDKSDVKRFVIKLELLINNKWVNIERYDTHHGHVHKDILTKSGKKKRSISYEFLHNKSGVDVAINDFTENYQICIRRYLNDWAKK